MSIHPIIKIFQDNGCSFPDNIFILDSKKSMDFWEVIFGNSKEVRFFEETHWLNKAFWASLDIDWLPSYNSNNRKEILNLLREKCLISLNEKVYFFSDPYEVIATNWETLTKYWIEFFELNDESFIYCEKKRKLLLISPLGNIKSLDINKL